MKKTMKNSTKKNSRQYGVEIFHQGYSVAFSPTAGDIGMKELYFKSEQQISTK
jgi:hypothetical protein